MTRAEEPIAIIGSDNLLAALINKLIDIAYGTPAGGPPQKITILQVANGQSPKPDDAHPLGGKPADQFHPFRTPKPPEGFPTLGEYVREMLEVDPGLESALHRPTHAQIAEYMEYLLDLAIMTAGDKVLLDVSRNSVESVEQETGSSPGTIHFQDGTTLYAKEIILA